MAIPKNQPIKKTFPANPIPVKPLLPKGPFHFKGPAFHLILVCFVIGLCFIQYYNSIQNNFSLDDEFVLHNDSTVAKGIKGIPELFKKRYAWDQKGGYGYRPVVKATYSIEYIFFKDSPHWGHFLNILFYAFVCIFLFYFFRKILYEHIGDYFLLIALLLYLVHPLHSEVVVSLKNRDEMLVLLFGFYCTYAFLKCFESNNIGFQIMWVISGCLSLGLGALCKPDAFIFVPITLLILYFSTPTEKQFPRYMFIGSAFLLVLPAIIMLRGFYTRPLMAIYRHHKTGIELPEKLYTHFILTSGAINLMIGGFVCVLVFLFLRYPKIIKPLLITTVCMVYAILLGNHFIIKNILPHTDYHRTFIFIENPLVGVHWYHKIPLALSTVWFYISKLLFPKDLISYYGYDAFNSFPAWTDFGVIAGALIAVALIYLVIVNIKKKSPLLLLLLLFGGTLFPYTDLFQVGAGIVAERFMFIPSVFFVLLITYAGFYLLKLPIDKKPAGERVLVLYILVPILCVASIIRVVIRNPDWKTHQTLYAHDVTEAPRSAKLQSLLAATYIEEAQKLKAQNPPPMDKIRALFQSGDSAYQKSLDIYPQYGTTWNNKGMIQYTLYGNLTNAITDFKRALDIDTAYSEAWFNLGACQEAVAQKINDTITALQSDSIAIVEHAYHGTGTKEAIYRKLNGCRYRLQLIRDGAENSYLRTINLKPLYYQAYFYLTRVYFAEARYDKEIVFDSNVIKKGYQNDMVYVTMGNAYMMMHKPEKAINAYEISFRYFDKNYVVCNILKKYYGEKGDTVKYRYYSHKLDTAMMLKSSQAQGR